MLRAVASFATVNGNLASTVTRGLHLAGCMDNVEEQQFTFDKNTGYLSVELDGRHHCAVVDGCGLGQGDAVVLIPCESANATCAAWSLSTPAHVDPDTPDAQWIVAPGSPAGEPHCLESPRGDTVDIYCCSGTTDCSSVFPKPITHQQWQILGSHRVRVATGLCLEAAPTPLAEVPVWPLPKQMSCSGKLSSEALISSEVSVKINSASDVAKDAGERYQALLRKMGAAKGQVKSIVVTEASGSEALDLTTDYSYSLSLEQDASSIDVSAASPYGVAYALETLMQLHASPCAEFKVEDAPEFAHRGLMIDTGRRFYPMSLLESILEGMAMYKMNVLHFHLSEECFRVESKVHPALHTANCTFHGKSNNEYYTQDEIVQLVEHAKARGIRVVPEFDMPGHSGGFCMGLESEGIQCCGSQIEDDDDGKSVALITEVLKEMMGLFPDSVMHIGCDETGSKAPCTLDNTKSFEEKVIQFLLDQGKTVMGWEEILFKTEAAQISTDIIVGAWARSSWQQAAQQGHPTVDSENGHFYLDSSRHAAKGMWLDIYKGETNSSLRSLLLGGEASMWQDQYVPNRGASCMFQSPQRDADFSNSTSSMIWPRTAIAAGSFWRYDSKLSSSDDLFESVLSVASERLAARGVGTCSCTTASSTGCSQGSYCGTPWCGSDDVFALV